VTAAVRRYGRVVLSPGSVPGDLRFPALFGATGGQRLAVDVILALAGFAAAASGLHPPGLEAVTPPRGAAGLALLAAATWPVAVRRRWPLPALAIVTVTVSALSASGRSPLALDLMLGLAAYAAAAQHDRRLSVPALTGAVMLLGGALAVAVMRGTIGNDGLHSLAVTSAAWFIGDSVRARRAYVAGLIAQAAERHRAEAGRHRQDVRAERMRIAREVHDVVGHTLAVMTVQAGVGRRLMGQHALAARQSLETIETTGRVAQDEIRLVLGLLRDDADGGPGDGAGAASRTRAELAPAPRLADLDRLVESVRAAGTPVDFQVLGDLPVPGSVRGPGAVLSPAGVTLPPSGVTLSPAMELSVFRIIQEALTNVVRHAAGARATVRLAVSPGGVRIEVADDGAGRGGPGRSAGKEAVAADDPGHGRGGAHGILGMRERVAAFGGSLAAGPRPDAGFAVAAWLPLRAAS
jgi:signal transduction histidine kinase